MDLKVKDDFINEIAQVIHLTTAFFLLFLGSYLEYSSNNNWIVFMITFTISIIKPVFGLQILMSQGDQSSKYFPSGIATLFQFLDYQQMPMEIFFAISDSIKYV